MSHPVGKLGGSPDLRTPTYRTTGRSVECWTRSGWGRKAPRVGFTSSLDFRHGP
jgi:hypothetical protein